jgi:flagellar biosynthesis component FlhA
VLCSSARIRGMLRRLTETVLPGVPIFCAPEIPEGITVQAVGQVQ